LHTEVLRDIYSSYIIKENVARRMRLVGHTACMWKGEKRILVFVEKVKLSFVLRKDIYGTGVITSFIRNRSAIGSLA
jgi:hypothetical protein